MMVGAAPDARDPLLRPAEVASLFRVTSKTVTRWERQGLLVSERTLGGHRRYRASEVRRAIEKMSRKDTHG